MAMGSPADVIRGFAEALEQGDLERMLDLYEGDATFAPSPGETVSGDAAIRQALQGFLAIEPRMTGQVEKVLVAGDTAFVANRWSLRGTSPDGDPIELGGTSADVLRRQADGSWKIAIDDPWGAAT